MSANRNQLYQNINLNAYVKLTQLTTEEIERLTGK